MLSGLVNLPVLTRFVAYVLAACCLQEQMQKLQSQKGDEDNSGKNAGKGKLTVTPKTKKESK